MPSSPAKFWDKHARRYAASPIKDMAAYEHTLGRTRSHLTPTSRVLELGCGTGATAVLLAPDVAQITGTDVSPKMIAIAQDRAAAMDTAHFQVAEAADLPPGPFDAILAFNMLHLVPDADAVIAAAFAALPPGGVFISKTVGLADPSLGWKRWGFGALIPVMRAVGLAPFVRLFTFQELDDAMTGAGFDIAEVGNFPASSRYIVARKPSTTA